MSNMLVSTAKVQARLCQNLKDPPLGGQSWNRLLQQSEIRSIFLTYQWLSAWWDAFRDDGELYVFAVLRADELIGIAPMMLRRTDGVRVIEFLGAGSSDYCDFICDAEDKTVVVHTVLQSLMRRRDRWDRITLRYVPEHSSTREVFSKFEFPQGLSLVDEVEAVCPALSIENSLPFAQACIKKKSLVRHTRWFERQDPLDFYHILDPDEVIDVLPEFFEQHRDRRFMAGDRSLFDDTRHRRFYERMVMEMLQTGWLRFSILRWQGSILGFHLGFFYNGVMTWYKPTFNVDYARHSPGEVLLKKLLEASIEEGAREFDFTVGNESFKERFANVMRHNLRIQVIQESRQSPIKRLREESQRRLKENQPGLYQSLKRLALRLGLVDEPKDSGSAKLPRLVPVARRFGLTTRLLQRIEPAEPVPSEFKVRWARYSDIKEITRRESLKAPYLMRSLARMRSGEKALVALWHDRPVALLWLARDPQASVQTFGFPEPLPEGAALITDSYVAADVKASPRRETLMPTMQVFLASEGTGVLLQLEDSRRRDNLPRLTHAHMQTIAKRSEIGLLIHRFGFYRRMEPRPSQGDS